MTQGENFVIAGLTIGAAYRTGNSCRYINRRLNHSPDQTWLGCFCSPLAALIAER